MRIAIHQPNFFPYYPFFQKMQEVDLFVILGHCQFEKNNYQNRFHFNGWNTMSVNRGLEPIVNKEYVNYKMDWEKISTKNKLDRFTSCISKSLFETNTKIIKKIANELNIETLIKYDYPTQLKGTDRLVDICERYGATEYLSGVSGLNYLELDKFKNIKVTFQDKSKMINKPILEVL
jgi:hypothetical protein